MKEIWKDIPGYEGIYIASNFGNIKRLVGKFCRKERLLKQTDNGKGYKRVDLSKNGISKPYRVHRIILLTFIGICPIDMESLHIDGNSYNNNLNNLKWGSKSENAKDTVKHGTNMLIKTRYLFTRDNHPSAKLNSEKVILIKDMIKDGLTNIQIGKIFSVNRQTIRDIRLNRTWKNKQ